MSDEVVAAPWQNRPSVLAVWEHTTSGFDLSGEFQWDFSDMFTQDNLATNANTVGSPICIPRACRMTRVCINFRFNDFLVIPDPLVQFEIWRNVADCEVGGYDVAFVTFLELLNLPFFQLNCLCFDTGGILFDECDQWFPAMFTLFPETLVDFPIFRVVYHFELR